MSAIMVTLSWRTSGANSVRYDMVLADCLVPTKGARLFVSFGLELPFLGSATTNYAPWMETANPADSLLADVHQSQRTTRSV